MVVNFKKLNNGTIIVLCVFILFFVFITTCILLEMPWQFPVIVILGVVGIIAFVGLVSLLIDMWCE